MLADGLTVSITVDAHDCVLSPRASLLRLLRQLVRVPHVADSEGSQHILGRRDDGGCR